MSPRRTSIFKQIWNKVKIAGAALGVVTIFTGGGYFAGYTIAEIKLEREFSKITTSHQRALVEEFGKGKTAGQEEFRKQQEDFIRFIDLQEKTK